MPRRTSEQFTLFGGLFFVQKNLKKIKKSLQKVLTRSTRSGIIVSQGREIPAEMKGECNKMILLTIAEIIIAGLIVYGFVKEDKVVEFEQRIWKKIKEAIK